MAAQNKEEFFRLISENINTLDVNNCVFLQFAEKPVRSGLHFIMEKMIPRIVLINSSSSEVHTEKDFLCSVLKTAPIPGWVMMPISFKDEHLGIMAIGYTTDIAVLCERLRLMISGILKSILVIEEQEKTKQQLQGALCELSNANEQLSRISVRDELTGLYNRRGFLNHIPLLSSAAERNGEDVALVLADLDNLKVVNDTWGHSAGDEMIRAAAFSFKKAFRQIDIVSRIGGDEFAIACRIKHPDVVQQIMERLNQTVRDFRNTNATPWTLSISVGYSTMQGSGAASIEKLMEFADADLYEQKRLRKSGSSQPGSLCT